MLGNLQMKCVEIVITSGKVVSKFEEPSTKTFLQVTTEAGVYHVGSTYSLDMSNELKVDGA